MKNRNKIRKIKNVNKINMKNICTNLKSKLKKVEWIAVISLILAIISICIDIQIRHDTAELTKLSDKSLYYKIRLFPTNNMKTMVNMLD